MLVKVTNANEGHKSDNTDTNKLWNELRNGNKEAISKLFCRYYSQLYNYGYNIVKQKDLVRDCIQELFLTLWRKRNSLNKAVSVEAYLISSLRRKIMRQIEQKRNREKRNEEYVNKYFGEVLNIEQLIIHFEIESELEQNIEEAINSLSSKQMECIYLKFYHGLKSKEIAEVMDINIQTVYNHVSEAISNMQAYIRVKR